MVSEQAIDVAVAVHTDVDSLILDKATMFASDAALGAVIEDTLGGLTANTQYNYKIYCRPAGDESDAAYRTYTTDAGDTVFSFHTARTAGAEYVFTVSSDEHGQDEIAGDATALAKVAKVYDNVLADSGDFHFTLGDLININGLCVAGCADYNTVEAAHLYMRQRAGVLSTQTPYYFALGNREHEEGWRIGDADSINAWTVRARLALWANPQYGNPIYSCDTTQTIYGRREDYYSWEWGDVLFVVLDPYWYTTTDPMAGPDGWQWTLGIDQYNWLYNTLDASSATWKLVLTHQLTSSYMRGALKGYGRGGAEIAKHSVWGFGSFEWGGEDSLGVDQYATKRAGWTHGDIHDMLDAGGVQLVIKGHDHGYCYQDQLDPPLYVTLPKAIGASSDSGFINSTFYPDTANNVTRYNTGHLRCTVYGADSLMCEYVRAVLDSEVPLVENGDTISNREVSHSFTLYP